MQKPTKQPILTKLIDLWFDLMMVQFSVSLIISTIRFFKRMTSDDIIDWSPEEEFID